MPESNIKPSGNRAGLLDCGQCSYVKSDVEHDVKNDEKPRNF